MPPKKSKRTARKARPHQHGGCKQCGGNIFTDIGNGLKKGYNWVKDNRGGIKQAHDFVKNNKLVSRVARAVGRNDIAAGAEQYGYGCQCGGRSATKMKFAR